MSTDKKLPAITIDREYGAGGRTIAKGLSNYFDIPWYDKDFVLNTAKESGYSVEDIEKEGEQLSSGSRFLNSVLNNSTVYSSSHDKIFEAQKKVILDLSKEPCIIVGRCANFVLREAGIQTYSIFLYADIELRIRRAGELAENGNMDLRKYVEKIDAQRETYCRNYTHHSLGDYHLHDLCLNSGRMSMEENVEIIAKMIENVAR
ncbi:MAG: cytidylate kinase-like family protein [Eubacteriales bacterium]|jgi:cytidylate kinase